MTKGRPFPTLRVIEGGTPRNVVRVFCGSCEAYTDVSPHWRQADNARLVAALTRRGWIIGRTAAGDRCPACAGRPMAKSLAGIADFAEAAVAEPVGPIASQTTSVETATMTTPLKAAPPREPSREERRLIILAIEEHWIDAATGYAGDTTDRSIADGLKVPVAWVAAERRALYGEIETNESAAALKADIEALQREMADHLARTIRIGAECDAIRKENTALCARIEAVEARAKKLPRAVR